MKFSFFFLCIALSLLQGCSKTTEPQQQSAQPLVKAEAEQQAVSQRIKLNKDWFWPVPLARSRAMADCSDRTLPLINSRN